MNYKKEIDAQTVLIKEYAELERKIFKLLNSMEEFSWKVILHNNDNHPALEVTQDSFVMFVEQFTHQLSFLKGVNPKQYEGVKKFISYGHL